jgi:hypothetical protein
LRGCFAVLGRLFRNQQQKFGFPPLIITEKDKNKI